MLKIILNALLHLAFTVNAMIGLSRISKDINATKEEKYAYARKVVVGIAKKMHINIIVSGTENLPRDNGFLICPNHQSRFDSIALIPTCERQMSFLVNSKRADLAKSETNMMATLGAKRIDSSKPREMLNTINEITDEVSNGTNYCIFLEGQHNGVANSLQKFNSGSLRVVFDSKCPVVPVCLYDVYKVDLSIFKRVECHVDYLAPICFDEYKDLTKAELAELIKSRIQAQIDFLDKEKEN